MSLLMVDVCDAVVVDLNAGIFSKDFTAKRSFAGWQQKLKGLTCLQVDVMPTEFSDTQLDSQTSYEGRVAVDIVIRDGLDPEDVDEKGAVTNEAADPYLAVTEEVMEFFMREDNRRLTALDVATLDPRIGPRIIAPFVPEHFPSQYTGVVRVTFDVAKDLD